MLILPRLVMPFWDTIEIYYTVGFKQIIDLEYYGLGNTIHWNFPGFQYSHQFYRIDTSPPQFGNEIEVIQFGDLATFKTSISQKIIQSDGLESC